MRMLVRSDLLMNKAFGFLVCILASVVAAGAAPQGSPSVVKVDPPSWWARHTITGVDGIRQDTIQYMPRRFIRDLCNSLHRQYPKMWMVGGRK